MIELRALYIPTTELDLGIRVRRSVDLMRARRLGDLCLLRIDELWRWGASQQAVAGEIRPGLARHGLAFRGEPTPDPAERGRLDALLENYVDELAAALAHDPEICAEIPVAVLRLEGRARDWVRHLEIYTVGSLLGSVEEDLWESYSSLWHEYWADQGLPPEERSEVPRPTWSPAEHEAMVDDIVRRLGSFGLTPLSRRPRSAESRSRLAHIIEDAVVEGFKSADLGLLDLHPRTLAYLSAAGVLRIAQLLALTGSELEALLPDGARDLAEVGAALAEVGVNLGGGRDG